MEPHYMQAERLYQVHGARGEDPTEPPASGDYPFPAVSHEPRIQQLADDLAAAGHQPFHAPCGVMLDESNMPYSTCVRCQDCDGFPCLVHAKSDAEVISVRPALEHDNVTLLTGAQAVKLNTDAGGKSVTEVVVERGGETETYTADVVVASCGAANSARLLLASATDKHPNGLANGSDQVGRNYMFHNSQAVLALSKEPNPTIFQKTLRAQRLLLRGRRVRLPAGEHPDGGQVAGADVPWEKSGETKFAPDWTLENVASHAVDFWLSTEDLPKAENRVTLGPDGHVKLAYTYSNNEPKKQLLGKLESMLGDIGMHPHHLLPHHAYLKNEIPVAGVAHQTGTCRFGADPADSVLDTNCKAHELDNLRRRHSFFPSIGAVNPALTTMANAIRVGDHLLERLGA
jgi:choline dehydrogenase-like flavoprotein